MKKSKLLDIVFWGIFIFYICLLVNLLFLRGNIYLRSVNLIPFETVKEYINVDNGIGGTRFIDVNIWGNILIMIPAGIYLMLLLKQENWYKALLMTAGISLAAEVIQYMFAIGASDIDDIILNTVGGGIGIAVYLLMRLVWKTKDKMKKAISLLSLGAGIPVFVLVVILTVVNM